MPISGSYRRKGGSGTGRLRGAAVCLGLAAFLAAGCAGTSSPPPQLAANPEEPPLPISDDGLPRRDPVHLAQLFDPLWPRRPATLAAKPAADDRAYRLPSLKLATDGPVLRLLEPTNDGPWSPDQAVLPWAEFHDNQVTVHNIRNSYYRTVDDYTVRLYNKTFDLRKLTSVDFIVVPFNDNPAIAHVMLSFGFEDKDYLVSSVEIRKRAGQTYSALTGFFNQYTLMYVLADERDVLWKEHDRLPAGDLRLSHEGHAQAGPGDVRRRDAAGEQAGPRAGVLQHDHQQLHHERPQPRQPSHAGPRAL